MNSSPADARLLDQCRAALQASEARFRNIIERNADGVVVVSRDGTIRFLNAAAERLFGCRAQDWIGRSFGVPIVPQERTEVDLPRDDRPDAVAEMHVTETEWEGEPAYLASLRDVTERKRTEEALKEAGRRKDEFLAMLAHELRNPLAPIRNALHVMRLQRTESPDAAAAREIAERQVAHLTRLIDDLLDVSRVTKGRIVLHKQPLELSAVVALAVETSAPLIDAHRHELSVALPAEPIWVEADATRLGQVLANLLNNAAKYTDDGGRIALTVERDGNGVAIRLRDNGIGIEPEMLSRIYEPFAQADRSLDRSRGGLGIGLTLVRCLVELHGGTISARSAGLGRGSEFTVRLPVIPAPAPAERDGQVDRQARRGVPKRVLVVEDQADAGDLLGKVLQGWGHEVSIVHDGHAALEAAEGFQPDVILLDIGLPGMDGYEVAARLRARPDMQRTVLIAVTGYGQEEDRDRSQQAGFHRHLVKPVDPPILEELLAQPCAEILDGHQRPI